MRNKYLQAYTQQKSNAKQRGVAFNITFEDWKRIWLASGKWDDRGRGTGKYCMCRFEDKGAYQAGNVFIALNTENLSDGNLGRVIPNDVREKISRANSGVPHPWSLGDKNPMHRPETKAKIRDATSGTKHYRSKGGVFTPVGFFESTVAAASYLGIPIPTVQWRCRYQKFGFFYGQAA